MILDLPENEYFERAYYYFEQVYDDGGDDAVQQVLPTMSRLLNVPPTHLCDSLMCRYSREHDSMEKIRHDAKKHYIDYFDCANASCNGCHRLAGMAPSLYYNTLSCEGAQKMDLVERTIKVMEKERE